MSEKENRSIDETVEELRRQIQEITDDAKEAEENCDSDSVEKLKNNATDALKKMIEVIKNTSNEVAESEQFKNTCAFVEEKSKQIVSETKKQYKQMKENPELQAKLEDAKEMCTDAYDKVSLRVKEDIEKMKENEKLMSTLNKVKDVAKHSFNTITDGVDEFISKPEVSDAIEKGKETMIEVAEKAVDALKGWLKPKNRIQNEQEDREGMDEKNEESNDL